MSSNFAGGMININSGEPKVLDICLCLHDTLTLNVLKPVFLKQGF